MPKPGRQSREDISTAAVSLPQRPEPPESLNDEEKEVWEETVNPLKVDWFQPEQLEILANYCRHVVRHRQLHVRQALAMVDPSADTGELKKIHDMLSKESSQVLAYARSMRITHQARYDTQKAARQANNGNKLLR